MTWPGMKINGGQRLYNASGMGEDDEKEATLSRCRRQQQLYMVVAVPACCEQLRGVPVLRWALAGPTAQALGPATKLPTPRGTLRKLWRAACCVRVFSVSSPPQTRCRNHTPYSSHSRNTQADEE
jgi:hypothetical protein